MSRPWTAAHRREALRRCYEIAAPQAGDGSSVADDLSCGGYSCRAEKAWRQLLADVGLDAARIRREVRRVRGLAEGWLVREVTWHVRMNHGGLSCAMDEKSARMHAQSTVAHAVVRVTRIRKAGAS